MEGQGQRDVAQVGGKNNELANNMDRMKDMGIVDEGLVLQVLYIMEGVLQAAMELIFLGWDSRDDSMQ